MIRSGVLAVTVGVVLALSAGSAAAATVTVNTTRDETVARDGQCSLREAIQALEASGNGDCGAAPVGANRIVLGPGTYKLVAPNGELQIGASVTDVTIEGAGPRRTVIDAGGLNDRVLEIASGPTVKITGVTITGGHAPDGATTAFGNPQTGGSGGQGAAGGAILNGGTLTMVNVALVNNSAGAGGQGASAPSTASGSPGAQGGFGGSGGAIATGGELTLSRVTITGNRAGAGGNGGDAQGSTPGILRGNGGSGGAGGAVAGSAFTVSVHDSTLSGNSAGAGGAGGSGGSGSNGGRGGDGGAIDNVGGRLEITNDTIVSNAAGDGGAGGSSGPGGSPGAAGGDGGDGGSGGGVAAGGTTLVNATTVANNSVGAGGVGGKGTASSGAPGNTGSSGGLTGGALTNTLLASNRGGNCSPYGVDDYGRNLSYHGTGCAASFASGDPKLGSLQNNGGPTPTMALGPGSAAIDQVPAKGARCPPADQRGVHRPAGPACDIGAYEVAPPRMTVVGAQAVGPHAVKIIVSVTPNAGHGTLWVQYGRTKSYGRRSAVKGPSGVIPIGVVIVLRGLNLRTVYHYRAVVSTMDGTSRSADVRLAVPLLGSLRISPSSFTLGHGATVSYTDSRPGLTTFIVQRRVRKRWVTVGTFTHRDRAGGNSVRFGRRRGRFAPGVYRLVATPRNGRASGFTLSVRFTLVP